MSFFSKKKDDAFFDEISDERAFKLSEDSVPLHSPNALTPDEVLNTDTPLVSSAESTGALDALRKRLAEVADKNADKDAVELKEKVEVKAEITPEKEDDVKTYLKKESLLDKCLPYILDEDGNEAVDTEPIYHLQSVAEILKEDSEKTIQRLSEKYDFSFDDLGKFDAVYTQPKVAKEPQKSENEPEVSKKKPEQPETLRIKNIQSSVPFVISDIDTPEIKIEKPKNKNISNTATITFTPVKGGDNGKSRISVSSQTRPIDLTGEIIKMPEKISENANDEVRLEKDEFGEYIPDEEYTGAKEGTKLLRKLFIKKRRAFLQTFFSLVITFILALAQLPALEELLEINAFIGMIVCSSLAGVALIINADVFLALPRMFSKLASADTFALSASVLTLIFSVFSIVNNALSADILLLLAVILSMRAIAKLLKASYMLSNIRIIASSGKKNAVKLINDNAVTFAMSKNFIEGDVLIAAPKKVDFVDDYLKYATFGIPLGGALRLVNIISLLLSAIMGVVCAFYFDGAIYGFYAAAAIQCIAALPMVFFLDNLPIYRASKKLNRKGAMLAGKIAAQQIETANAAVINARDIFPSGTVTLHQMKVLSENDLQDTLIRAASLTESMMSTLEPIFKKIAGTSDIVVLPDSDTVKYEDKMGISGWVDNRLLFIGNRTLMEAHGIEVPSIDVDRKILRSGFFPVYVATGDKACALLVIQYNVDPSISRELRKLTASGVTLLVNSSDPNLTEEMICDYLGLYDDSVKIMTSAGCHMYNTAIEPAERISAPAAYKGSTISLAAIMNCAARIKKSNILLTIVYVISLVFGVILFAYSSLGGSGTLMSEGTLLLYGLISTVVSYLVYLTERP